MATNAGPEYYQAQGRFNEAKTNSEKIKALEEMLKGAPDHKSSQKLRAEIKTKIAKLREKIDKERTQKSKGYSFTIKKEGAAQVVITGITNSGKSTILKQLTNANPRISEYEFTTKEPDVGSMDYNGVKIQLIEMPAIFPGCADKDRYPQYFATVRNASLIIIILDGTKPIAAQIKIIEEEYYNSFIQLGGTEDGQDKMKGIKTIVTVNKGIRKPKTKFKFCKLELLKQEIWKNLNLTYIFTKTPGKDHNFPPVALKIPATVEDLAEEVHKDFLVKFKFARVWGKSVKHQGAQMGLDHILKD